MSKEVKRFYITPGSVPALLSGVPAYTPVTSHLTDIHTVPLVLASDYDALLAERDALKKVLDRQVPLHDAIQRAAGDLPEGWEIRLCVEHHAGWVELIGPDGTEDFATNDERLDYTVIDALEHALQGEQQ